MPPVRNARVLFNSVPKDYPIPGETTVYDTTEQLDLDGVELNGGFLAKTLVISIDPFLRGRMRSPEKKSYAPPFELGKSIQAYGIALVLRSETPGVDVGKHIYGMIPVQEYTLFPNLERLELLVDKHPNLPLTAYVGAAGMPGQTAYAGWRDHADPKKGEVVFVSTGAGPVGSFVIQLAKEAGCKVIGSAGSEEKLAFMKSIGADVVFNYKTTDTREVLAKEGPVDIYWDNVGGEILDAAFEFAAIGGRFILCGSISGYNTGQTPIKNLAMAAGKTLHIHGTLVFRAFPKYAKEFFADVPGKLASGEIKYTEEVSNGLDKVGDVILAVQKGENKAKAVIVVAEE
ncbi:alcohol dehydrogenase [Mycena amicta]|nr:alcohol dehydrogenase [Mycena amicta]